MFLSNMQVCYCNNMGQKYQGIVILTIFTWSQLVWLPAIVPKKY